MLNSHIRTLGTCNWCCRKKKVACCLVEDIDTKTTDTHVLYARCVRKCSDRHRGSPAWHLLGLLFRWGDHWLGVRLRFVLLRNAAPWYQVLSFIIAAWKKILTYVRVLAACPASHRSNRPEIRQKWLQPGTFLWGCWLGELYTSREKKTDVKKKKKIATRRPFSRIGTVEFHGRNI